MTTTTVPTNIAHYLDAAGPFVARVDEAADWIDAERQMPPDLAGDMADAGFFRLLLPRDLGGAQLAHPDFLQILEQFAAADASVAWCLNQNNVFATSAARMPVDTAHLIWGEPRAVVTNGPPTRSCLATPVEGGYRLNGRWNLSSGSDHATWIAALSPVAQGGQNGATASDQGPRILLMPKPEVNIVDLWHTAGLRGTGSFSFDVDDRFIAEERTYIQDGPAWADGPLYQIPRTLLFATGFATVALGVARKSLEIAIGVGQSRMPYRSGVLLRDQQTTQRTMGEAHAQQSSARAFLKEAHGRLWDSACSKGTLTIDERIQLRVAATHAIRTSAQVVDAAYTLCGASGIFQSNPIQRRFQDMHVITQHVQGHYVHYETAGQFLMGLEPQGVF
ncbi:Pigment production hydroxylase [Geodia barretti]|uniref:Pigment production hydroxylase n=1 Tax=Geodia barretti TaxID=519541 RepID=A0AA35S1E4_GEOBA|nr:Pigment production hydroxylase [Geodia barretti]